jgi:hypothetical protein
VGSSASTHKKPEFQRSDSWEKTCGPSMRSAWCGAEGMLFSPSARGGAVVEAVDGSVGAEANNTEHADWPRVGVFIL